MQLLITNCTTGHQSKIKFVGDDMDVIIQSLNVSNKEPNSTYEKVHTNEGMFVLRTKEGITSIWRDMKSIYLQQIED